MSTSASTSGVDSEVVPTEHRVPNSTDNTQAKLSTPANWRTDLHRMVVYRAGLVDKNGNAQARKPLYSQSHKILGNGDGKDRERHWSDFWWGGQHLTLAQCQHIVDKGTIPIGAGAAGPYPGAAKDIAHMPWLDDMFVIDCDRKTYYDSPDGSSFVTEGNTASMAATYTRYGLDDLYREAADRGMPREELDYYLDSWTEGTKSNGCHIVLGQNPELRYPTTTHHKHEYRVDVIASPNNWRGCYPSPGYTVLKDRPIKVADKRLVELLITLNRELDPVGGKRMVRAESEFKAVHRRAYRATGQGIALNTQDGALMDRWRAGVLNVVHIAHQEGGWNDRIFWAACRYAEGGWPQSAAERDILSAAQPWDVREERGALDTINSAYNNVARSGGVTR